MQTYFCPQRYITWPLLQCFYLLWHYLKPSLLASRLMALFTVKWLFTQCLVGSRRSFSKECSNEHSLLKCGKTDPGISAVSIQEGQFLLLAVEVEWFLTTWTHFLLTGFVGFFLLTKYSCRNFQRMIGSDKASDISYSVWVKFWQRV